MSIQSIHSYLSQPEVEPLYWKTCALQNWFSLRIGLNYAYIFKKVETTTQPASLYGASFHSIPRVQAAVKNLWGKTWKDNPWHLALSSSFQFLWSLELLPCFSFPFVPFAVNVKPTIKPTAKRVAVIFTLLMVAWMPSLWALTKRPKRWKQRSAWVTWVGFIVL